MQPQENSVDETCDVNVKKELELYTTKFDLNFLPLEVRKHFVSLHLHKDITKETGASIKVCGQFVPSISQSNNNPGKFVPVYLSIQGSSKESVEAALTRLEDLAELDMESSAKHREKVLIGIDNAPPSFDVRNKVLGPGGANLQYITNETGVIVTLRGKGSGYIEPTLGQELPEALHLLVEHNKYEVLQAGRQLAFNLVETVQQEWSSFQQQQQQQHQVPPPTLQHTSIPSNVVLTNNELQSSQISTVPVFSSGQVITMPTQGQQVSISQSQPLANLTQLVHGQPGPGNVQQMVPIGQGANQISEQQLQQGGQIVTTLTEQQNSVQQNQVYLPPGSVLPQQTVLAQPTVISSQGQQILTPIQYLPSGQVVLAYPNGVQMRTNNDQNQQVMLVQYQQPQNTLRNQGPHQASQIATVRPQILQPQIIQIVNPQTGQIQHVLQHVQPINVQQLQVGGVITDQSQQGQVIISNAQQNQIVGTTSQLQIHPQQLQMVPQNQFVNNVPPQTVLPPPGVVVSPQLATTSTSQSVSTKLVDNQPTSNLQEMHQSQNIQPLGIKRRFDVMGQQQITQMNHFQFVNNGPQQAVLPPPGIVESPQLASVVQNQSIGAKLSEAEQPINVQSVHQQISFQLQPGLKRRFDVGQQQINHYQNSNNGVAISTSQPVLSTSPPSHNRPVPGLVALPSQPNQPLVSQSQPQFQGNLQNQQLMSNNNSPQIAAAQTRKQGNEKQIDPQQQRAQQSNCIPEQTENVPPQQGSPPNAGGMQSEEWKGNLNKDNKLLKEEKVAVVDPVKRARVSGYPVTPNENRSTYTTTRPTQVYGPQPQMQHSVQPIVQLPQHYRQATEVPLQQHGIYQQNVPHQALIRHNIPQQVQLTTSQQIRITPNYQQQQQIYNQQPPVTYSGQQQAGVPPTNQISQPHHNQPNFTAGPANASYSAQQYNPYYYSYQQQQPQQQQIPQQTQLPPPPPQQQSQPSQIAPQAQQSAQQQNYWNQN